MTPDLDRLLPCLDERWGDVEVQFKDEEEPTLLIMLQGAYILKYMSPKCVARSGASSSD